MQKGEKRREREKKDLKQETLKNDEWKNIKVDVNLELLPPRKNAQN